uniref:B-cell receptor CD22 n=1 Tax=Lates calcarifer TaxID=8187 RepID=A0A4W6EGZ0_LATCA
MTLPARAAALRLVCLHPGAARGALLRTQDLPISPLISCQLLVQGQDGWGVTYTSTQICAFKGSTVNIHCTYRYPPRRYLVVQERFWFIKQSNGVYVDLTTDPEYSRRVKYNCENNRCTLTITNLRESDSAVYKFRFTTNQHDGKFTGEPGVTVSVSGKNVVLEYPTLAELTCHSSCQVPDQTSYVWYKNGQEVKGEKNKYFYTYSPEDNYRCSVIMCEFTPLFSLNPPKLPSVSVSPSGQIVEGSSVTLTCSSEANPAATCTWYKENQQLPHEQNGIYHFTSISSEDIGYYHCKCGNNVGQINSSLFIDVQYPPKLPSVSVSPSGQIVEGSSVTLTCSSDANPAAKYTWYKTNGNLELQPLSKESLTFSSIQSSDSGDYHCTAENELGNNTSKSISIDVTCE